MFKAKIRFYHQTGPDKGNLKTELFFDSVRKACKFYVSFYERELYALNPTLWEYRENPCLNNWFRLTNREIWRETEFKIGDKVKLNPDCEGFMYGRGIIYDGEVGKIVKINGNEVGVNFSWYDEKHPWSGLASEIVFAEEEIKCDT